MANRTTGPDRKGGAPKGCIPWNKGLTATNDCRVAKYIATHVGVPFSQDRKNKISEAKMGKKASPALREKMKGRWTGHKHPKWDGSEVTISGNRKYARDENGRRRREHTLIAERALDRKLKKGEVVHHVNMNSLDNRNANLLVCTQSYHSWLHQQYARKFAEIFLG